MKKKSSSLKAFTSKTTKNDKTSFNSLPNKNISRMKSPKNKKNLTNSNIMTKTSLFASNKLKTKSLQMPLNTKKKKSLSIKNMIASKNKLLFISTEPKWDKIKSSSWLTNEKSPKHKSTNKSLSLSMLLAFWNSQNQSSPNSRTTTKTTNAGKTTYYPSKLTANKCSNPLKLNPKTWRVTKKILKDRRKPSITSIIKSAQNSLKSFIVLCNINKL